MSVSPAQRFGPNNVCPACRGHSLLPSGHGARCFGFLSDDGLWAHCTREEHAGGLSLDKANTYAHRLEGLCRCGRTHGAAPPSPTTTSRKRTAAARPPFAAREERHVIREVDGTTVTVHCRAYAEDGSKRMWWERPGGLMGLGGVKVVDLPLYGAHEINGAARAVVVEGETARDALAGLGIPDLAVLATVTGSGTIPSDDVLRMLLSFSRVDLWPDAVDDGAEHMAKIGARLLALEHPDVRLVGWRDAPPKGDAKDFVAAGGTAADALQLLDAATPLSADGGGGDPSRAWTDPVPLADAQPLPCFDLERLPPDLRGFAASAAVAFQVPEALPAMVAISTVAAAVAGNVVVRLRADWTEPTNAYTATALGSGSRKTAIFAKATQPLYDREEAMLADHAREKSMKEAEHAILEKSAKRAEDAAAKATGQERTTAILIAQAERIALDAVAIPVAPRLVTADVTQEKLAAMLSEQGGRMAVFAPEGELFGQMAGRYSDTGPRFELYLSAHGGDTIRTDRLNRPPDIVKRPALTVCTTVQPSVIQGIADTPAFRARGLTARFWFALPLSNVGHRDTEPAPLCDAAYAAYVAMIGKALDLPARKAVDAGGHPIPFEIVLSPESSRRWSAFFAGVEIRLREDGDLGQMPDWGGKFAGHVARLAALLHVAAVVGTGKPWDAQLPAATLEAAIALGDGFLVPHAAAAYALMATDPARAAAEKVLRWIRRRESDGFTKRELHQSLRRSFSAEQLDEPLAVLVQHGHIRLSEPQGRRAGRPSDRYEIHPGIRTRNPQSPQNTPCPEDRRRLEDSVDSVYAPGVEDFTDEEGEL